MKLSLSIKPEHIISQHENPRTSRVVVPASNLTPLKVDECVVAIHHFNHTEREVEVTFEGDRRVIGIAVNASNRYGSLSFTLMEPNEVFVFGEERFYNTTDVRRDIESFCVNEITNGPGTVKRLVRKNGRMISKGNFNIRISAAIEGI